MFHNPSAWNAARNLFSSLDSAYIDSNYLHVHSECAYFRCGANFSLFSSLAQSKWWQASTSKFRFSNFFLCPCRDTKFACLLSEMSEITMFTMRYMHMVCQFAHICICICIRNHVQKYREPFPEFGCVDLFLCLPNHLHSNEDCAFSMGNCIESPEKTVEYKNTFALFKNGQILVHISSVGRYNAMPCASALFLFFFFCCCSTECSSFSISRRSSNAFAWLKSIFAFSCTRLTLSGVPLSHQNQFRFYANGFDCVTQCDNLICIRFENHSVLLVRLFVYNLNGK